jgi:hypothetical protein
MDTLMSDWNIGLGLSLGASFLSAVAKTLLKAAHNIHYSEGATISSPKHIARRDGSWIGVRQVSSRSRRGFRALAGPCGVPQCFGKGGSLRKNDGRVGTSDAEGSETRLLRNSEAAVEGHGSLQSAESTPSRTTDRQEWSSNESACFFYVAIVLFVVGPVMDMVRSASAL